MASPEEAAAAIYLRTKQFLYEDTSKQVSQRLKKCGFQVLMGPPHLNAPLLFLGYQPGKGCKTALEEREYGSEDRWPDVCEYATEHWRLAQRLQDIFDESVLRGSVGLNAIFVRADSIATYETSFDSSVRRKIEALCLSCVKEIVCAVQPKKVVVIGFSTLKLLSPATWSDHCRNLKGRVLIRRGSVFGYDAVGVLHLTGARMSKADRQTIATFLRKFP